MGGAGVGAATYEAIPGAAVQPLACGYQPRDSKQSVLRAAVSERLATLRREAAGGHGLPRFTSALRMRPVFHHAPWRIQAHVTICVLSLLLERIAEIRAGDTWRNICAQLETIKVVEYDRGEARIQQTTQLRREAEALLKKLGAPPPPKVHSVAEIPAPEAAA